MNSHTFWELPKGRMNLSASNKLRNKYILNFKRKKYLYMTYMFPYQIHFLWWTVTGLKVKKL